MSSRTTTIAQDVDALREGTAGQTVIVLYRVNVDIVIDGVPLDRPASHWV